MNKIKILALACLLGVAPAWGAQISAFSPQGEVAQVQSVKLRFNVPVISFGNAQAPAPVDIVCNRPDAQGHGRWLDGSNWTYEFTDRLGPGLSCQVSVLPTFLDLDGAPIAGKTQFRFQTGGPKVISVRPQYTDIAEDQMFALRFDAAVDAATVVANTYCLVEGLGEVVPVRQISGEPRKKILESFLYSPLPDTQETQIVQCQRLLPPDAKVQLQFEPGIAMLGQKPTVVSKEPDAYNYTVRSPFAASFSCTRENSSMPCTPLAGMSLRFSSPILKVDAEKIRLQVSGGEQYTPVSQDDSNSVDVQHVDFAGPFPESSEFVMTLPSGLKDDSGRVLGNAEEFPLVIKTAAYPPLVKFAASPFGVIERFAYAPHGGSEADHPASVPLSVRRVEASLPIGDLSISAGRITDFATQDDQETLRWYARVQRMENQRYTRTQIQSILADQEIVYSNNDDQLVDTRGVSLLKKQPAVRELVLPGVNQDTDRPFELVGVPLTEPGFHVLEVASGQLGKSLIEPSTPMYVRTTVLLTNLGVHLKTGRDDTLAWVTTLDGGEVVPNAQINVLNCRGEQLAQGTTDELGVWHHAANLLTEHYCSETGLQGLYVSARIPADHPQARGKADFSFVFSSWNDGIESWRFNVSTDSSETPTRSAHTVFDRSLFRAGETVSMKHYLRDQTRTGLANPESELPSLLVIQHQGSDDRQELPIHWKMTPSGGLAASNDYALPKTAKLGIYTAMLMGTDNYWYGSQEFRVEEFKLPLLTGSLKITDKADGSLLIAPSELDANIQLSYLSGGPAGKMSVSLSGVLRDKSLHFPEYEDYSFEQPRSLEQRYDEDGYRLDSNQLTSQQALFLDKQRLTLDAHGGGRLNVTALPDITQPRDLLFEASFADPNGEIQTLTQTVPVWSAGVVAGIQAINWAPAGQPTPIKALSLSTTGQPQAGVPIRVSARTRTYMSTRQRLVGGFYSYQNRTDVRDLGLLCEGTTNEQGLLACSPTIDQAGQVELVVTAVDDKGRASSAATNVWLLGKDELWFGGNNDDRIDLIPARKNWKPGETAEFQVRMPFRQATALVAVEREGVLATYVVQLDGKDPTVRLPVLAEWGPNVFVSVLALRGRVREVPWYSFFQWGWNQPLSWYQAYSSASSSVALPTSLIDLAKPSFRFGLAEINVSDDQDQLVVKVTSDQDRYQVRDTATVTIQVTTPDGKPASNGTVAFAAVDQALLELSPNTSWDVLPAMRQLRSYGVETATAQMQIVGRRHYGRKALPAGGGGGKSPTRELLDTLLLWQPDVVLDQDGKAQITLPLNDAITRFTLVAIADHGSDRFGTGSASIVSTQDLQVISGLPAQVREGDEYQAMVTVRNSATYAMQLEVNAAYAGKGVPEESLASQTVSLAAGEAQTLLWTVTAPESNLLDQATVLNWTLEARDLSVQAQATDKEAQPATDALAFQQTLVPVHPVRTQQSTLLSLDADSSSISLPVAAPPGALPNAAGAARGGLQIHLQSSLAGGLSGVHEWFSNYPYTCLEQLSSKAIGLRSQQQWDELMSNLHNYLDDDGLASYFPGARYGNEVLTAYLLTASDEARSLGLPFAIPEDALLSMRKGLENYVLGKLTRTHWSPAKDNDVRKLAALEALSRYGQLKPRVLDSLRITPNRWPTGAVIDWMALLQRIPSIPDQANQLSQARQIILGRMLSRGTELVFADNAQNNWWWLMVSPETNLAKLMLLTLEQPEWQAEQALMAQGLLNLQRRGAWRTTTANLMGSLAIRKFAQHYEREPVSGNLEVQVFPDNQVQTLSWSQAKNTDGVLSLDSFQPWGQTPQGLLLITADGKGQSWATVSSLAAVAPTKPVVAGYQLERTITPVTQAKPGVWSRGDVYRVRITVNAKGAMSWAALTDPIPAGASILGSGLGRDSSIATASEVQESWHTPTFIERSFDSWRGYYEYLPSGKTTVEYTVRLNTPGQFNLPPTRIETLYNPEVYGVLPNLDVFTVQPGSQD